MIYSQEQEPDETDEAWERRLLDDHARLWRFYTSQPKFHHVMYWDGLNLYTVKIPSPAYSRRVGEA